MRTWNTTPKQLTSTGGSTKIQTSVPSKLQKVVMIMNDVLCFILNENPLFLDEVLIELDHTPLLFICKDKQNQYYAVLATDIEKESFVIVKTDVGEILRLFSQKISMRDLFVQENEFWSVIAGETPEKDRYTLEPMENIPTQLLPYEDSPFLVATETLATYQAQLKASLWKESIFKNPQMIFHPN